MQPVKDPYDTKADVEFLVMGIVHPSDAPTKRESGVDRARLEKRQREKRPCCYDVRMQHRRWNQNRQDVSEEVLAKRRIPADQMRPISGENRILLGLTVLRVPLEP
jgi:hypothetical protein